MIGFKKSMHYFNLLIQIHLFYKYNRSRDTFFPIKHVVTKSSAGIKRAYKTKYLCKASVVTLSFKTN
jgi:hypothetical protein